MARNIRNRRQLTLGRSIAMLIMLAVAGCSSSTGTSPSTQQVSPPVVPTPSGPASLDLVPVRFVDLPGWRSDDHRDALTAFQRSCVKLSNRSPDQMFGVQQPFGTTGQWQEICAAAHLVEPRKEVVRKFFETWFVPYRATNAGDEHGLFTGYYEPVLHGSWQRTARYSVPIYRQPPEAKAAMSRSNGSGATLPSRAQINSGALAGRNLELLWVDDPIDAFFMEIQGSGQIEMADGTRIRVGFAGKNGHRYVPIGAELIRRGEIAREAMSMQAIRDWLVQHPSQARPLMEMNPSYVFFNVVRAEGPIGAQGVPLTAGRSIAVDPSFVPYSVPVWLDSTDPMFVNVPMRRLVVAQDTGGAIKGPVRGDLFWGSDGYAAAGAGAMKQDGRWFLLLPRASAFVS